MTDRPRETRPLLAAEVDGDGHLMTVTVRGEADLLTAPRLADALATALAARPAEILVDLTEVTFFGSAGLHTLLAARKRLRPPRPRLMLACSPIVKRVMTVTDTMTLFDAAASAAAPTGR